MLDSPNTGDLEAGFLIYCRAAVSALKARNISLPRRL